MFEGGFEIGGNLCGDDLRGREIGGFFEGLVFQPEDVQVQLVAFDQFIIAEGFESLRLRASTAIFLVVAGDEVVQVAAFESVFLQREMQIGSQVVDPELLCPRSFLCRFAVEEQDVRLHALGVEDPGRQPQQRMNVALLQQLPTHDLPSPTLEEDVIGHDNRSPPLIFNKVFTC